jgi:hypothetical protein
LSSKHKELQAIPLAHILTMTSYMLFFGSFDAIVVVSSVFILFPHEQTEHREAALQHFRWTIERFEAMQIHNSLAKSALGVLKTILCKFIKAIDGARTTSDSISGSSLTPASSSRETAVTSPSSALESKLTIEMLDGLTPASTGVTGPVETGGFPSMQPLDDSANGFGFMGSDSIPSMPVLPTSDLVWSDLSVLNVDGTTPVSFGDGMTLDPGMVDWQFGGGFGDDNLWQFLNQRQPGQA